jgi:hypothetical protein
VPVAADATRWLRGGVTSAEQSSVEPVDAGVREPQDVPGVPPRSGQLSLIPGSDAASAAVLGAVRNNDTSFAGMSVILSA